MVTSPGQHMGHRSIFRYYDYPADKKDMNVYSKWLHSLNNSWSLFADLQYRHVGHHMDGFEGNPDLLSNAILISLTRKQG